MKTQPKSRRRSTKWVAFLVLLASLLIPAFAFSHVLLSIVRLSAYTWEASRRISHALDGARSVEFVEYAEREGDRLRIAATPEQIAQLRHGTTYWLIPSRPKPGLCFNPHHRIEIVKADGSLFKCTVCFECNVFEITDPPWTNLFVLPDPWNESLANLLESMKMKPYGPYETMNEPKGARAVR
jgi:hypothetical protein